MTRAAIIALVVTVVSAIGGTVVGGRNLFWSIFWVASLATIVLGVTVAVRALVRQPNSR